MHLNVNNNKLFIVWYNAMGPSINDVGNWEGAGVKNWPKLPTDSTKKLPTWGKGVSKIQKICRRHLWMVPMFDDRNQIIF